MHTGLHTLAVSKCEENTMSYSRGERAIIACRMIAEAIDLPSGSDFPELVEEVKKLKEKLSRKPVKKQILTKVE